MRFKGPFIVLFAAAMALTIPGFWHYNHTQKALIKVSIFDLSAQLTDLRKWQKWDKLMFKGKTNANLYKISASQGFISEDTLFDLRTENPAFFVLQKKVGQQIRTYYISLKPVNADVFTQIEWSENKTGFEWLAAKLSGKNEVGDELNSLKAFAENPSHLYGYAIKVTKVTDQLVCLYRKTWPANTVQSHIPQMIQEFNRYLSAKGIPYKKDYYYISYFAKGNKTEIAVGIPVNKEVTATRNIEILKFPANGHLLVGDYNGPRSALSGLYNAMDKYVVDKKMSKVALPMEKYPASYKFDTAGVNMQLIYPVY